MMPRYSFDQPWNFGVKPSDYSETLSLDQQSRVHLPNVTLRELDELHELTLGSPGNRKVVLRELHELAVGAYLRQMIVPCLLIARCKPFGEFDLPEYFMAQVIDKLDEYGVPFVESEQQHNGNPDILAGFSQQIVDTYISYQQKREAGEITKKEFDIISGILFGLPIGDVFSWTFEYPRDYTQLTVHEDLFYASFPAGWSQEWRDNVGNRAAEHLRTVYYQSTTDVGSLENSILSALFFNV